MYRMVSPVLCGLLLLAPSFVRAQMSTRVTFVRWEAAVPGALSANPLLVSVPDSVRQRVGYQHWKGAAIGSAAGVGALLLLALAARGSCADCGERGAGWVWEGALLGVGGGGALGFLIGLASPRYERVPVVPGQ